ncbi:hypothetical protein GCM10027443_13890 [Pontibacter brevis]
MVPKVSVLIPLFNSEKFIAKTIQSVLDQTWENIEIIVVDDGSTDNSYAVAKSFETQKVKVYKQLNKGACAARNYAFSVSTGEYIQYLDADDLLSSNKIESQLELLQKCSINSVSSCIWGRFYSNIDDFRIEDSCLNKSYKYPIQWLIDSWNGKGMGQTSIWLTPRSLIIKAGVWNESLKINQDGEFFSRIMLQADEIIFCSRSKIYYRSLNANSVSKAPFTNSKALSLLNSFKLYVQHVPEHSMTIEVKRALARNFAEIIYRFDNLYPQVSREAWIELNKLKVKNFEPVGGKVQRILTHFLGFKKAIQIRNIVSFFKG